MRRATGEHDAGRQPARAVPGALELATDELEDLIHPLVDDMRDELARGRARALPGRRRQAHHLARVDERRVCRTMPLFQALGIGLCHAEALHEVARDVRAGVLERREVADLAFVKDRDPGRAAAHFHKGDAELFLVIGQHRVRRRQRLEHEVGDAVAGALHALAKVLRGGRLHGDEVHLHFEARPRHADRIGDAPLLVDDVFLRDVVQQLVITPERHGARDLVHPGHVLRADFFRAHGDHTGRAARGHMFARDAARHVRHARTRHPLRILQRGGDGAGRLVDIAHHAAAHAGVLRETDAENLGERRARQIAGQLRDHGARLGAPKVESGDEATLGHQTLPPPARVLRRRTTTCPAKRASSSA